MSKKYLQLCSCCDPPIAFDNKQGLYYHSKKSKAARDKKIDFPNQTQMSSTKKTEVDSSKRVAKHQCHEILLSIVKTVSESDTLMENNPANFIEVEMARKLKVLAPVDLLSTDAVEAIIHTELSQLVDLELMDRIGSVKDPIFRQTKKNIIASVDEGLTMFETKATLKSVNSQRQLLLQQH